MASTPERRYTQEEIQEIFRRATERQAGKQQAENGLTLDELRRIGEESGIDPAHINAVARDIARDETGAPGATLQVPDAPSGVERFYRMPASAQIRGVVPGLVDDAAWTEIVPMLESVFQNAGETTEAGPIREWHLASSLGVDKRLFASGSTVSDWLKAFDSMSTPTRGPVTVEVRPEGDDTRVDMAYEMTKERLWEGPGLTALFLTIAAVVSVVFAIVGEPVILIAPAIMLILAIGLGGYTYAAHRNEITRTRERMEKAMDRIELLQAARHGQRAAAQESDDVRDEIEQRRRAPSQPDSGEASAASAGSSTEPLLHRTHDQPSEADASPSDSARRTRS